MASQRSIDRIASVLVLGLMITGCNGFKKPTPKNFTSALNYYFSNHDDCLFSSSLRFPYEVSTTGGEKDRSLIKSLDALERAGLLKSLEDKDIHVKRYELTTYGKRVPPRFCFGHRVITSIDGFTPPATVDGETASQVTYHYKMMDIPGWADSDSMRKAFPTFAKETSSDAQDRTKLVLTMNGWRVPE
jgi:hypothetical protein